LKQNKIFKYMQKRVDGVHNDLLDQRRRDWCRKKAAI
jgi:hypothetical protein